VSAVRDVVEVLARALTDNPDQVRVTESQHKGMTLIELFVAPGELGKVIGKQGEGSGEIGGGFCGSAFRNGDAELLEEGFRLILVNVHSCGDCARRL